MSAGPWQKSGFSTLRGFPLARLSRPEDCIDYSHIRDGVLDRHRNFSVIQNGLGKSIALQRVLVARRKSFRGDAAAREIARAVNEKLGGAVERGVDGDLDFDPATGAEEVDALVRNQLRAAGKDGVAAGEVENS